MFHGRISAWIAKFRWKYISVCSLVGHDWKLADGNTIDYQWTSGCIFLQQLINIECAPETGLESESQNNDDTEQSTEVDGMIDVVYEDETDDEANFLSKWSCTGFNHSNFRCRICSKAKYSKRNDILLILPVK